MTNILITSLVLDDDDDVIIDDLQGLAKVHFTAERTSHYKALQAVESKARSKKLNVLWNCCF